MPRVLGDMKYNGVHVKLVSEPGNFKVTVEYAEGWKEDGHEDIEFNYRQENIARMNFRSQVVKNVSIY